MKTQFYLLKKSAKFLAFSLLLAGFSQANAQGTVYPFNDTNIAIPDNGGFVGTTMEVAGIPAGHHIYYIAVGAKINHTWTRDLVSYLQSPNGSRLSLMHRPGTTALTGNPSGNSANLSAENLMVFTDYSITSSELMGNGLTTNNIIPAGHFTPSWNSDALAPNYTSFNQLANYYTGDKNANGTWHLFIEDVEAGDLGELNFVDMLIGYDRYCVPFFNNNFEFITKVAFGEVYDSVGSDYDHPDYQTIALGNSAAHITQGQTYPISVTIAPDESEYIYVFFDWNQDGDFNDSDETFTVASNVATPGPHIANITVPAGAQLGQTRMRVMLAYNGITPNPCFVSQGGEVEDFTVVVEEKLGVDDLMTNQKTTAHPNPIINDVNFTSKNTISQVEIYNASGQKVMTQNANAKMLNLNLSALPAGVYVAKIKTDKGTESIKLIKK